MPSRRLLLIRHAKAATGPIDEERPLTGRGIRDAEAIGAWLAQSGLIPDHVLVSPARRAMQTWERASAALTSSPAPTVDPRIYDDGVDGLLAVIRETPKDSRTLVLVGHNPSVAELADALDDGDADPAARREMDAGFKTSGVALFVIDAPFSRVTRGGATLTAFTAPRG